jgi:hypothetical protein
MILYIGLERCVAKSVQTRYKCAYQSRVTTNALRATFDGSISDSKK